MRRKGAAAMTLTESRRIRGPVATLLVILVSGAAVAFTPQGAVAGQQTTTMTPPYDRSYTYPNGQAVADRDTGDLRAVAVAALGVQNGDGTWGWIEVDHFLASDAISVTYEIALDQFRSASTPNGSASIWASASGPCTGCFDGSFASSDAVTLTLSNPDGVIPKGRVTVRVLARASATVCLTWCQGFPNVPRPAAIGFVSARVASITATADLVDSGQPPIALEASGYREKGMQKAELAWSGATSLVVDIYRDEVVIATTENEGAFTDHIDQRGKASYVYRVCEADTSSCSNEAVVEF